MPLITPPDYKEVPRHAPIVFLIGPIQGTGDWQNPLAKWFLERLPNLYVASPRSEMWNRDLSEEEKARLFKEQAHWEHSYIQVAMKRIGDRPRDTARGAILAWCAKEQEHNPKRAYAQTTRYEIGKILGWINGMLGRDIFLNPDHIALPNGVFIGADPEYSGRRYLENDLANDNHELHSSIERTRYETLKYLQGK